ncbi:bifunctional hydroxymethylpyrimidine kinase/phosphomethylpyrimidine kinase [Nesterenkonia sphaerica]|uniref:Bifunctional hydroxymethylpyrimidine kinase/phosphomethylpyrimidine kinase n=1 Tax=Nesterenkonia sphaerica TaxID=1804988 RepID=A0A5R9AL52_9MICC|nr:bifunctional hydroxymethylpyrimidine kinase/phosphomethylpyrimidine kinase [Nesterenkonia sphaerica]TLP79431.1 bifunctional hydroxymethylpyrimidine kinase/phosphomethylpyrimidine kinase [Nesterenkonia sphaerica]
MGIPNILSIAGTDPTGGAGIQADLKSFAAHGGYGMCVVTALVAQNTQGVRAIHAPPVDFLLAQLEAVSDDVTIHAAKTGMLGTEEIIDTVSRWWDSTFADGGAPTLVVDPVMVATSGDRLLNSDAESSLIDFLHRADLVTPNVPELAILAAAEPASSSAELLRQAQRVADAHQTVVLAKGGHMSGPQVTDSLVFPLQGGRRPEAYSVATERIETTNTHGTGCSVSAAFATLRARGLSWQASLDAVKDWMQRALYGAAQLNVGHGNGPINHFP